MLHHLAAVKQKLDMLSEGKIPLRLINDLKNRIDALMEQETLSWQEVKTFHQVLGSNLIT